MPTNQNQQELHNDPLLQRAIKKLGPGNWSVTARSLQQATAWQVARAKASWLGDDLVFDLCCGIGGDAIALARRGKLIAVDADPEISKLVAMNLDQVCQPGHAQVWTADVTTAPIPSGASIHIDPDRRPGNARTVRPQGYQPTWAQVCGIVSNAAAAVVKLAPAAQFDADDLPACHRCWIALQGTVREQSVICGTAIDHSGLPAEARSALSIDAAGATTWYRPSVEAESLSIALAGQPQGFLVDPHAAVRAAGLTESFAIEHGLSPLCRAAGFLTCDDTAPLLHGMATVGNVIWTGACDDRKLRRQLRALNAFPETVKVRQTDHDPAVLTKRYRKCGENPVTLWIGRVNTGVFAAITTPI